MRKILATLILPLVAGGCAWSHYQTAQVDGSEMKCWSIVLGKGKIGADCRKLGAKLASEDTGISDNGILALRALAEGAVKGMAVP